MAQPRWRLQVFRADGSIEREETFHEQEKATAAFDKIAPAIPKRLQVRRAGAQRYETIEVEGGATL